jgi:hypothetical protein
MKPGRRSLLTPALTKKICAVLEKAGTVTTACAFAGIGTTTYHTWVSRGENNEPEFREFAASCARARATAKQKLTDIIVAAAPKDWKAASWLLEKLYPREYGRIVSPQPQPPPEPEQNALSDAEVRKILDDFAAAEKQLSAARNASE